MTYPNRINVPPARNSPDNCENFTPRWGSYEENSRNCNHDLVFISGQVKVISFIHYSALIPHFTYSPYPLPLCLDKTKQHADTIVVLPFKFQWWRLSLAVKHADKLLPIALSQSLSSYMHFVCWWYSSHFHSLARNQNVPAHACSTTNLPRLLGWERRQSQLTLPCLPQNQKLSSWHLSAMPIRRNDYINARASKRG